MDHEYGAFVSDTGGSVNWILQNFQLSNGVSISVSDPFQPGDIPVLNVRTPAVCTIQVTCSNSVCHF